MRRLDFSIQRWTTAEMLSSGAIALISAILLVTSKRQPYAPFLGRWLALSIIVLWIAALRVWYRR